MGTIEDKLNKLLSTKEAIKAALIEKGQTVEASDTFASYPDKIRAIESGGSNLVYVEFTSDMIEMNPSDHALMFYVPPEIGTFDNVLLMVCRIEFTDTDRKAWFLMDRNMHDSNFMTLYTLESDIFEPIEMYMWDNSDYIESKDSYYSFWHGQKSKVRILDGLNCFIGYAAK